MENNYKKLYSLLGLCKRAGRLVSGGFMTEKSIKEESACLVIIAGDASDNTKKQFRNMAEYREIPLIEFGDKESLGNSIGCEERTSIAILDEGFAKQLISKFKDINEQ